MRRTTVVLMGCGIGLLSLPACSDSATGIRRLPDTPGMAVVSATGTLDQNVVGILSLFPKGLETAATARWTSLKKKYAAGLSDPSKMKVARQMLVELSDWVTKKAPEMDAPPNDETRVAASGRAVLYMSMYLYSGPSTPVPAFAPQADVAVGIVTPTAPATIVTPTKHAGVQLEAGSVDENTIVVITQNPTPYPANCSGPLETRLCQYPQFYFFDQFPHKVLLKPAKFNVCHINTGENRRPLADHDRFRLAHAKPDNPADYTPGSIIRDQNGESIEILPLIEQTFSTCEDNAYPTAIIGAAPAKIFSRLARSVRKLVTPKTAYAIDLGLGGLSRLMSPFNDVDPLGQPDLRLELADFREDVLHPRDHLQVAYRVSNVGTATGSPISASIRLTSRETGQQSEIPLGTLSTAPLAPGQTVSGIAEAVIPASALPGVYVAGFVVGSDPVLLDLDGSNNRLDTTLVLEPEFVGLQNQLSVGALSVCALAGSTAYCWGRNDFNQFATPNRTPLTSAVPILVAVPSLSATSPGSAQHACGINASGSAVCWGRGGFGELGSGSLIGNTGQATAVAGGITWSAITVSRLGTCGVSTSSVGYCWGSNQKGEAGSADIALQALTPEPHILDGGHTWKSVVRGWLHSCGITVGGEAYCWGDNSAGQLGIGSADSDSSHRSPARVATSERFLELSLGTRSTCGITINHDAFCWGENGTGQIGDGTTSMKAVPTRVAGGIRFSFITVASGFGDGASATLPPVGGQGNIAHTCALDEAGRAYCWGWNGNGQLGDGTTTDRFVPQPVSGGLTFTNIGLGGSASCASRDSRIWCWGSNFVGQLGNGSAANATIPTPVAPPFDGSAIQ